jgi:hypothetical protein
MERLSVLKPASDKRVLIVLAGLMWSGVGVMLGRLAFGWLRLETSYDAFWLGLCGILLGLNIYRFGFSRFADKNIRRIKAYLDDKICIFAFQEWSSYPLVMVMISLGIFLREYSLFPKSWLSPVYMGIGCALFLASLHYYRQLT